MNVLSVDFRGKRALVTGAGSGIGRALSLRLAELGAQVFALSLIQTELNCLKAGNANIETICVDLANWESAREAVKKITPINLLVNCAVTYRFDAFSDVKIEDINSSFDVIVKGVFNTTQAVASDLITRGEKGSIVNMSSTFGQKPVRGSSIICACLATVESLTRSMALELSSKGVRANVVSPNLVLDTNAGRKYLSDEKWFASEEDKKMLKERTPQGKYPCVNDVVNTVVYLLSDYSDPIVGHSLPVDGGYLCC